MSTAPGPQQAIQDPVKADPKHYKVELENDRVRVLRISYGPREKSVMHTHPDGIAVFLTENRARFTFPDGKTEPPVSFCASAFFAAGEMRMAT